MKTIIAIDPGAEHCGVAVFRGGECVYVGEKSPTDLFDWWGVGEALYGNPKGLFDVVIMEAFRLYPGVASAQSWSTFGTVEVIGVLRERCRREGVLFVTQPASAKKATRAILKAQGVVLKGKGDHAKDAELHGWHYLMKGGDSATATG